ncbi:GLCNAC1PUT2 [Scenedesmus sp. PABB004]|nr:GLCNAC1PUT2 [Scenedesmus sp. PABB004]
MAALVRSATAAQVKAAEALFEQLAAALKGPEGAELVSKTKGLVVFSIDGDSWTLDLRSSPGSVAKGAPGEKPDLTLTISDAEFVRLVMGKLSPQQAFLLRKLKLNGSMGLAMKLQPILDAAAPRAKLKPFCPIHDLAGASCAARSSRGGGEMAAPAADALLEQLRATCAAAGQEHILNDWHDLTPEQQRQLAAEVQGLDFAFIDRALKASLAAADAAAQHAPSPVDDVITLESVDAAQRAAWQRLGLRLIREGRVGVLLLAGGQGTRLGSSLPKVRAAVRRARRPPGRGRGARPALRWPRSRRARHARAAGGRQGCYDIGLPSGKSLFALQAERLLALQRLAAAEAGGGGGSDGVAIPWYIMTSPFTHADTLAHFEAHGFFGLSRAQVTFFQQGTLPCLTHEGRVIMQSPCQVASAPDGNGGLYRALQASGALAAMAAAGLVGVDVYCVDNALARLGDPVFVGACVERAAALGARVLAKAHPGEKVGVFARDAAGRLQVLEYSELPPGLAESTLPGCSSLAYGWSNICMHWFSLPWLQAAAAGLRAAGAYHLARKAIPAKGGGAVGGLKLEMFIFDPFASAERATLLEVERAEQFAPVKNAPGSAAGDSPNTARAAVLAQGARWVVAAGGALAPGCTGVEVPPLLSYAGEGLERLVAGRVVGRPGEAAALLGADGGALAG